MEYEHITDEMKKLHKLPIEARLYFKIITLVWKLYNMAPSYITDMLKIKPYETQSGLCSYNNIILFMLITKFKPAAIELSAPVFSKDLPQTR